MSQQVVAPKNADLIQLMKLEKAEPRLWGSPERLQPMKTILTIWMLMSVLACQGQQTNTIDRKEILSVYSFSPHLLTDDEQTAKSKDLDVFWEKAKAHSEAYLPVIKNLLEDKEAPPFFLYDGGVLLLTLSDTHENRRVALKALSRCDLRDVDRTAYLRQVHRLAVAGEDVSHAAFHILDDPKFKAYIPQHALTLSQDFCLICMLFPTDPANWLSLAIERLKTECDPEAQRSLLTLLWYAQTSDSDKAIAEFADDKRHSRSNRSFARKWQGRNHQLLARTGKTRDSSSKNLAESESSIRQTRMKTMNRISDEALSDFDRDTLKLIGIRQ